jgi:hypothetical protein
LPIQTIEKRTVDVDIIDVDDVLQVLNELDYPVHNSSKRVWLAVVMTVKVDGKWLSCKKDASQRCSTTNKIFERGLPRPNLRWWSMHNKC